MLLSAAHDIITAVPANTGSHHGTKSPVALIVVGIVFVLIGGFQATRPALMFKANAWQFKNKEAWEPSRAGLIGARIAGAIAVVVGVVVLVIGLTKL
ncbi:hypothetical protein SAMN05443575_3656 [Jatrophihabitans endophyticus]|uniref:DUF6199 domain-containing protein n=1 Tax=Jatrophihabitans endophyticus TaxID=1206085 RepID=A0A1M5RUQ1_9ACTN|nr:DUF6199 family natural product biosynthesis protein [Jatrophihabitans endophyticus]SHH30037.1 hypothetical protein SAMN05443575_3656 [Jatrophihabitans endophyticus]